MYKKPYTPKYLKEIKLYSAFIDKDFIKDKTIAITGATGLIGSYLIDCLLAINDFNGHILALIRNKPKAIERFSHYENDKRLSFEVVDLEKTISISKKIDYIIHLAGTADPKGFTKYPVETLLIHINGTKNMLELAKQHKARLLLISSTEVYGKADFNELKETDYGIINSTDPRSCYNIGKKAGETLAVSYGVEYGVDVVITRLSRCYGPTMKEEDSRVIPQFIRSGLVDKQIIIKSKGQQLFSFIHVADTALGLLFLLKEGKSNEVYNLSCDDQFKIYEIAEIMAKHMNVEINYGEEAEKILYSKGTNAVLSIDKIKRLGWKPKISTPDGLKMTIDVIQEIIFAEIV
jgi:nucleoside-diphosphate-sugar epimerase